MTTPYWERAEHVETFAARAPDKRLLELIKSYPQPPQTRVLDLGCAGGRNTVVLAKAGFDVHAIDSSSAMVQKTRERVAAVLGAGESSRRVRLGQMEELQEFPAAFFHLIVALGVYQNAVGLGQWSQAIAETVRVLTPEGKLLVANFSPESDPGGEALHPVNEQSFVYDGFSAGPMFLIQGEDQDQRLAEFGLTPVVPTDTVTVSTKLGCRVTVNSLYYKRVQS